MQRRKLVQWFFILLLELVFLKAEGSYVDITYLDGAIAKGAVCLDGSPPAYHLDKGFGDGINSWLIQVDGGGWCDNVNSCLNRSKTDLGSSKLMQKSWFGGIMSNEQKNNPDFYNWNRVRIRYCDGSSFTSDIEAVDSATNLHFRGARIFVALVEDLLAKGLNNAENALLSGTSAGALTSILHCDNFQGFLPKGTRVKCLSDGGFFINVKDISGAPTIEDLYKNVVDFHGSAKNLPTSCTSVLSPHLCFFPQNIAAQIQTPLFILNTAYDSWQIQNILVPGSADPDGVWHNCFNNFTTCSPSQLENLQDFRLQFIKVLSNLGNSTSRGLFINSCDTHCQSEMQQTWFMPTSPKLNGISNQARLCVQIGLLIERKKNDSGIFWIYLPRQRKAQAKKHILLISTIFLYYVICFGRQSRRQLVTGFTIGTHFKTWTALILATKHVTTQATNYLMYTLIDKSFYFQFLSSETVISISIIVQKLPKCSYFIFFML